MIPQIVPEKHQAVNTSWDKPERVVVWKYGNKGQTRMGCKRIYFSSKVASQ